MTCNLTEPTLTAPLREALDLIQSNGESVALEREGRPVAALVSLDTLRWIEEMEDRIDLAAVKAAEAELRDGTDKLIPWNEAKAMQLRTTG